MEPKSRFDDLRWVSGMLHELLVETACSPTLLWLFLYFHVLSTKNIKKRNGCFSLHRSCEEYREMVWAWNSWFHGGWRRRLTKKKHWVLAKCDGATSTRFSQQTQRAILEHVILNSVMGRNSEKHVIIFYYVHSTIWHHHKHDHPTSWCLQPPIHCECSVEAVAALEWRPALLQTLDFQDLRKARFLIY